MSVILLKNQVTTVPKLGQPKVTDSQAKRLFYSFYVWFFLLENEFEVVMDVVFS